MRPTYNDCVPDISSRLAICTTGNLQGNDASVATYSAALLLLRQFSLDPLFSSRAALAWAFKLLSVDFILLSSSDCFRDAIGLKNWVNHPFRF
jgi:hypothetical protein